MLWLLLIVGALIAGVTFPRLRKTVLRLSAVLLALVILLPLALVVTFQRMRLKRRRRNAANIAALGGVSARVDRDESPGLDRAIASP